MDYNLALEGLVKVLLNLKEGWSLDYKDCSKETGLSESEIIEIGNDLNTSFGNNTIVMTKTDIMLFQNRMKISNALSSGQLGQLVANKGHDAINNNSITIQSNSGVISQNTGSQSLRDLSHLKMDFNHIEKQPQITKSTKVKCGVKISNWVMDNIVGVVVSGLILAILITWLKLKS